METNIYFGADFIANKEFSDELINKIFVSRISNLRKQLKEESNIDVPPINIMDNINIGRNDIIITIDGNTKWKQNFESIDRNEFEKIADTIISELKKIYIAV